MFGIVDKTPNATGKPRSYSRLVEEKSGSMEQWPQKNGFRELFNETSPKEMSVSLDYRAQRLAHISGKATSTLKDFELFHASRLRVIEIEILWVSLEEIVA